jgi:hypothetical protein
MSKPKSTRREFTKEVALLAVASTSACAAASAGNPPRPAETPASVGQALAAVVRLRYGRHLTEEQFKRVQQGIERNLRSGNALRQPPLHNGDEPDFLYLAEML